MANESEFWWDDENSSDFYPSPFEDYYYHHRGPSHYTVGSIFIIFIIVGVVTNVLGLASLIHFRMWLKHEGYVYLVAMFAANIGILLFDSTTFCITHWNWRNFPADSSEFMCRIWHFLMTIYFVMGWLSVALLFNVYLREHLTQRRRCGCPMFAAKFCTLFASKIVVGIVFGVVFILGLPYMGIFSLHHFADGTTFCSIHDHMYAYVAIFWLQCGLMWILPIVLFLPVILLLTLCISHDGDQFGFSGIEERSLEAEQFRVVAVTLSSMNLFSHFVIVVILAFSYMPRFIVTLLFLAHAVAMCFQPLLCFIILAEFRKEVLRRLRDVGCCKCLPGSCIHSGDVQGVRLQEIEEEAEE